jgi:hypothetical protein
MKTNKKWYMGLCVLIMIPFLCAPALAKRDVTITGTVMAGYQIEDEDGQIYDIDDNEKGEELAQMVDSKVRVTGTLEEEEDMKIITVASYTVLDEE